MAASPHTAARQENRQYDFREFKVPQTDNTLLIETAGGIFSPIDDKHTMLDMVEYFQWEAVLITKNYLGSINHTLLCLETVKRRNIDILALVVNGKRNESSETFIQNYANIEKFIYVPELKEVNQETIRQAAANFQKEWIDLNI